jgi:hypothetical protein
LSISFPGNVPEEIVGKIFSLRKAEIEEGLLREQKKKNLLI